MKIKIFYYAILREKRKLNQEEVQTAANTPQELYCELDKKFNFGLPLTVMKAAVNNEFCYWSKTLNEGDEVIFVPPVAGG